MNLNLKEIHRRLIKPFSFNYYSLFGYLLFTLGLSTINSQLIVKYSFDYSFINQIIWGILNILAGVLMIKLGYVKTKKNKEKIKVYEISSKYKKTNN